LHELQLLHTLAIILYRFLTNKHVSMADMKVHSQHRNLRQCILFSCVITGNEITQK